MPEHQEQRVKRRAGCDPRVDFWCRSSGDVDRPYREMDGGGTTGIPVTLLRLYPIYYPILLLLLLIFISL